MNKSGLLTKISQGVRRDDGYWMHLIKNSFILNSIKNGAFNPHSNEASDSPNGRRTPEEDILKQLNGVKDWHEIYSQGKGPEFTFLGMRITTDCNLDTHRRCAYCDQQQVENLVDLKKWREIIDEVTKDGTRRGIYMGISGGEPLLWGDFLYGDNGLIRYATDKGGVVNLNTNFHLLTPTIATSLTKSGLAKVHVSLDAPDEKINDSLEGSGSFRRVWESIYIMQMAKKVIGSKYPVLHINTVATKRNLHFFDELLTSLLGKRRLAEDYSQGDTHTNPDLRDLAPHLILLGGEKNKKLRPSEEDWKYFIDHTWPNASRIWEEFQEKHKVPKERKTSLQELCFFSNPFTRVKHNLPIEKTVENFAQGNYAESSLCKQCYAAPTQAYVLPNGEVYPCGSHADTEKRKPIGNVLEENLKGIIKRNLDYLVNSLGENNESCGGCYGSTLAINQKVREKIQRTKTSQDKL